MRRNRERFRKASVSRVYDSRVDHLESQIVRSSFGEVLKTFPERRMGGRTKKDVGTSFDKRYLISKMTLPENWEELRLRLRAKTESRQAKLALTRRLGVSLAAISQWRSGASVPTAANAIQILRFVCEPAARRGSKAKRRTLTKNRRERRSPANTKLRITKGQSRK
jgi:DNA-binding transcriptional regulator YiaG